MRLASGSTPEKVQSQEASHSHSRLILPNNSNEGQFWLSSLACAHHVEGAARFLQSKSKDMHYPLRKGRTVCVLMQAFIDKFRFNAKRASLVQSRIKALERMADVEEVEVSLILRALSLVAWHGRMLVFA